jgi:hypothetical protein
VEIKELYIVAKTDEKGNVVGYPKGGGSSSPSFIRAFEKVSSAGRSKRFLGGKVMRVIAMEEV